MRKEHPEVSKLIASVRAHERAKCIREVLEMALRYAEANNLDGSNTITHVADMLQTRLGN